VTTNPCDKRGFTLIEVLVTLMILAFGMLATITGITAALDHNLMNEMRNDAIKIAQEQEEAARNMPYASIQTISQLPQTITRQVRNRLVNYTVTFKPFATASAGAGMGMTIVQYTVQWTFKNTSNNPNNQYSYVLQTIVRQKK